MAKRKKITKKQIKQYKKLINTIIAIVVLLIGGYFGYKELNKESPSNYEPLPMGEYYKGAEGLSKDELNDFLHDRLRQDFLPTTYADAKVALARADVDPNNPENVLTIYSRNSVQAEWISGNDGWTREHVWPNSRLGIERVEENDKTQASDLHNLRAIVQSVNSSRSDKYFDNTTTSESYYPGDDDKGDVARILFYMVVMYPNLTLSDVGLDNDNTYTPEGAIMGKLSVLLEWHKEDPVDDFERNRNEIIYEYQRNRNPFIDHPEFVHYIFEDVEPETDLNSNIIYYITIRREKYINA